MFPNAQIVHVSSTAFWYAADWSGLNAIARARNRASVLTLSYHAVIPDECAAHSLRSCNMITVSEFRHQLVDLLRFHSPISAEDFRAWLRADAALPRNPVLLTFDDGYANNLTHAVPVLAELGVPAAFFLPTGYIGGQRLLWPTEIFLRVYFWPGKQILLPDKAEDELPRNHEARVAFATRIEEGCKLLPSQERAQYLERLRSHPKAVDPMSTFGETERTMFSFLNWDEVRRLKQLGFTIGSHTVEHPILSRISTDQVAWELKESKATIERETGSECFCFCYPNGGRTDFTPEVAEVIRNTGYEFAFTLTDRLCRRSEDPALFDRVWIPGGIPLSSFRTRTSGIHGALRRMIYAS